MRRRLVSADTPLVHRWQQRTTYRKSRGRRWRGAPSLASPPSQRPCWASPRFWQKTPATMLRWAGFSKKDGTDIHILLDIFCPKRSSGQLLLWQLSLLMAVCWCDIVNIGLPWHSSLHEATAASVPCCIVDCTHRHMHTEVISCAGYHHSSGRGGG